MHIQRLMPNLQNTYLKFKKVLKVLEQTKIEQDSRENIEEREIINNKTQYLKAPTVLTLILML